MLFEELFDNFSPQQYHIQRILLYFFHILESFQIFSEIIWHVADLSNPDLLGSTVRRLILQNIIKSNQICWDLLYYVSLILPTGEYS